MPARLVLETDGDTEEVCLWFRPTATKTDVATHRPTSGKRRRERARRRRRRAERRREADKNRPPSDTSTTGVAMGVETIPPASPQEASPSTGTDPIEPALLRPSSATLTARAHVYKARPLALKRNKAARTATRVSQRAAVLAKKRGAVANQSASSDELTPEKLRGAGEETALNITLGISSPPPPPSSPSPASTPAPAFSTPPRPQTPPPATATSPTHATATTLSKAATTPSKAATTSHPPPPPPMSSRFPKESWKVLCQDCFYWDHNIRYYHCMFCHSSPEYSINKLVHLKKYAIQD